MTISDVVADFNMETLETWSSRPHSPDFRASCVPFYSQSPYIVGAFRFEFNIKANLAKKNSRPRWPAQQHKILPSD